MHLPRISLLSGLLLASLGTLHAQSPVLQPSSTPEANPATQPDSIDWDKAKQLYQRSQAGEKLTPEEQAYLDRAKQERARQQGGTTPDAQSPVPKPSTSPAGVPSIPGVRQLLDIPYVPGGTEQQRLDLYLPAASGAVRPLVVYVHGGSWMGFDKSYNYCKECGVLSLLDHGYAVASVNYRLTGNASYPAQIEDCKSAIRFLRAHAAEYGIKSDRIGAWGTSAGGHLVALLGTTGDIRDFDTGANLDQSSKVQCVVDFSGPTDFLNCPPSPSLDLPNGPVCKLLGGTIKANPEKARRASPVYFVTKNAAPFYMLHGDKDDTVPVQQAHLLDDALKKAGVECSLKIFPGLGHSGREFASPQSLSAILQFLDSHLKQ